LKSGN